MHVSPAKGGAKARGIPGCWAWSRGQGTPNRCFIVRGCACTQALCTSTAPTCRTTWMHIPQPPSYPLALLGELICKRGADKPEPCPIALLWEA